MLIVTAATALFVAPAAWAESGTRGCSFVVAGREATADGSVLVGYNNDRSASNRVSLRVVPGGATHRFLKVRADWAAAEGGLNDEQLAIPYRTTTAIDGVMLAADPYVDGGYGPEMWDRLLARCAGASDAVTMLAETMAQRGCSPAGAGAIVLADPREAWVFETLGGHHWAAARVPDDEVWFHPNAVGIREIDLSDPARFRGSPDLEEFAVRLGRHAPGQRPFDVAWAYADRSRLLSRNNSNRLWGALRMLAPSVQLAPTAIWTELPGHFRPERAVTPQAIAALLRSHYEGTPLDESEGHTAMSPHVMTTRPICQSHTDYSVIMQVRDWLPDDVGGVMWLALSRPCSSAFVPFYVSSGELPAPWRATTAFSAFRAVAKRLDRPDQKGRTLDYGRYIRRVRRAYGALESDVRAARPRVEAAALELKGGRRAARLTRFSNDAACAALSLSKDLRAAMK